MDAVRTSGAGVDQSSRRPGCMGCDKTGDLMNLGLDMNLQEELAEGVIHLSPDGQVTDFNRSAVPWVKCAMAAESQLRQKMAQISTGVIEAPLQIELPGLQDPVLHDYRVYLCTAGPKGYALFIANRRAAAQAATLAANDNDFFRLLGSQTRHALTYFRNTLFDASNEAHSTVDNLLERSHRLSRLLVALDQLSRLYQTDAFQAGERLSLWRVVKKLVGETTYCKCHFFITPDIESKVESESVIYGDATWLETSICTLLAAIAEAAPAHSKVEIRVRVNGGYMVLSSHLCTAPGKHAPHHAVVREPDDLAIRFDSDIGRQICHRVVAMHGGLLTITETDSAKEGVKGVASFVATFPLSAPARAGNPTACAICPMALQMDKYAKDIAFLLSRQPSLERTSTQEIQMLAKLLSTPTSVTANTDGDSMNL